MAEYVFAESALVDEQRQAMQQCMDPITVERLAHLDVGPGWRCLEVGAGGGSIAMWLADHVQPAGYVLATDVDISGLGTSEGLTSIEHDITTDPLPETSFDLVHARLVLLHLTERSRALRQMISALRPGGWLLCSDFDCTWMRVLAAPSTDAAEAFGAFHRALCRVLERAGADVEWGVHAFGEFVANGLREIDAHATAQAWRGGSAGARWLQINIRQLHQKLVATGLIDDHHLQLLHDSLADPRLIVSSYLTISSWGRRSRDQQSPR